MFGLMTYKPNSIDGEDKKAHQLTYCGTCKAIGKMYSQKSRLLLNHDIVFLSRILSELNQESVFKDSNVNFHSLNCFDLPPQDEIPIELKYSAAINVFLSHLKIKDNLLDEKGISKYMWNSINNIYDSDFIKAKKILNQIGFNVALIEKLVLRQLKIETKRKKRFESFYEPTAIITGKVFEFGFQLIDKKELANIGYELGFHFGKLAYLADAIKDLESDIENKRFNPIETVFQFNNNNLCNIGYNKIKNEFNSAKRLISENLRLLPIKPQGIQILNERLVNNTTQYLSLLKIYKNDSIKLKKFWLVDSFENFVRIPKYIIPKVGFAILLIMFLIFPKSLFSQYSYGSEFEIKKADCSEAGPAIFICMLLYLFLNTCCSPRNAGFIYEKRGNRHVVRKERCCD